MGIGTDLLSALGPSRVLVAGSFTTDGNGDVVTLRGRGYTAALTGTTGVYTITLDREYPAIESITLTLLKSSVSGATAELVSFVPSTGVITFRVVDQETGATAEDFASGEVHFMAMCRNTSVV